MNDVDEATHVHPGVQLAVRRADNLRAALHPCRGPQRCCMLAIAHEHDHVLYRASTLTAHHMQCPTLNAFSISMGPSALPMRFGVRRMEKRRRKDSPECKPVYFTRVRPKCMLGLIANFTL